MKDHEQLIANGNTEQALKLLIQNSKGRFKRQFLNLSTRLKGIEKRFHQGTLSDHDYQIAINKVNADLTFALHRYESHLNEEPVGTSQNALLLIISAVIGFIVTCLGIKYYLQEEPENCTANNWTIYIANAQKMDLQKNESDNVLFSQGILASVRNNIGNAAYNIKALSKGESYLNRDKIVGLFKNKKCPEKGIYANTTYRPEKSFCQVTIHVVDLELKIPGLQFDEEITLQNPSNVTFDVPLDDAYNIAQFLLATADLYSGAAKSSIKHLSKIEKEVNLDEKPELKEFVRLSQGNAYILMGNKGKAYKAYEEVKELGLYQSMVEENQEILFVSNLLSAADGIVRTKNGAIYPYKMMKDSAKWVIKNLNIEVDASWCYDNDSKNCEEYGRLYIWEAAKEACKQLGDGWHLPTDAEWTKMVDQYGRAGLSGNAEDGGKTAYVKLVDEGLSGFDALLGGNRDANGPFLYLDASGLYWSATESAGGHAYCYDFNGDNQRLLRYINDHGFGLSVRCLQN